MDKSALEVMRRPELMQLAKDLNIESIASKANEVLIDEIMEKGARDAETIDREEVLQTIDAFMRDDSAPEKDLQEPFAGHWRRAEDIPAGATVDLCIHEDMDELQVYDIKDGQKQLPLVQFTFMGIRGHGRKVIQGNVRRALESLGLKIRYMGINIQ